jgi:uncharacterized protein (TIGR02231 family)
VEDLIEERERIGKEMGAFPAGMVRYAGKISVELFSESSGTAEITVSYYVSSANWRPFHEIRVTETDSPVTLSMKGDIVQNTGEDWNGVNVRLSTGNPMLGSEQPILMPWRIDLDIPQKAEFAGRSLHEEVADVMFKSMEVELSKKYVPDSISARVEEMQTTAEFTLPTRMDIPSSSKPVKVEISKHVLDAEFFHYCASKLDTDAFLIAKIGGWESLNLLAGEVSIFQGNEYVGKTHIDPATAGDSMEISLGRDKGVIVTRDKGKRMTSKGMLGKNSKTLREWIITVRNTRNKDIIMKLVDQVPVSVNSAVLVDAVEVSGAEHDKDTGILTWSLNIPGGGSANRVLRYEVSYPKNGTVHLE